MSKYKYSNNTVYYQKARFFRKDNTNEFAYCIEPFTFFNVNSQYESVVDPNNLSFEQKKRIEKIAYFGYGYKNHTDSKWYAITQMMIWDAADQVSGEVYFTDSLNGNRVNLYQDEINEINNLINEYNEKISIENKTYTTVENKGLTIEANNTNHYYTLNNRIHINQNQIIIEPLKEGNYEFILNKENNYYQKPLIFYQSATSQNLIETGNLEQEQSQFYVNSIKTKIIVNKLDYDSKDTNPQGEADLNNSIITIYDINNKIIDTKTITDNKVEFDNLDFGKYYIKETQTGNGYTLNDEIQEIEITKENPIQETIIYNKVIKKQIKIIKKYGENNYFNSEKNIDFEIYNNKNELVATISTDENGEAIISLPYGKYTFIQKNSTSGYNKVEPFTIDINDTEEEIIELKDYKIPVPNTHTTQRSLLLIIIKILIILL